MSSQDISIKCFIDWNFDGSYTEETDYVISARGNMRVAPPRQSIMGSQGRVSEASVVLDNSTGRYSSLNSSGPLYAEIGNGKLFQVPIILEVTAETAGDPVSYHNVFMGIIQTPDENTLTPADSQKITFDCRSVEDVLRNPKQRTTLTDFLAWIDNPGSESDLIEQIIDATGTSYPPVLDVGMFGLPYAWLANESVLETLWAIAASTGGRFYGDVEGNLVYENAMHWLTAPHTTIQQTYTRDDFGNALISWDESELAETVTVSFTPLEEAQAVAVYESEFITVPPGATKVVWAEFSAPVLRDPTIETTVATPGGISLGDVYVSGTDTYATAIRFEIFNDNDVAATVTVKVTAEYIETGEARTIETASADTFWTNREGRTRKIGASRWLQNESQAQFMHDMLLGHQETPSLTIKLRQCTGNPRRKVGDRIAVTDAQLHMNTMQFYVTSVSWQYDSTGGFWQDLEGIRCDDVFPLAASPGYFILGTDLLAGTKVVFY